MGALRAAARHARPLIALALFAGCVAMLVHMALHSDAFRIVDVQVTSARALKLPGSLIGQNLWSVDLPALSRSLAAQQPQLKAVIVRRRLPDGLTVQAVERVPVAQVRLLQWYLVDGEGYLLTEPSLKPHEQVVILKGVDSPKAPLKVGRDNGSEAMRQALRFLVSLRLSPVLIGHRLVAIDVSDPKQLVFAIDDDIEIRCGSEAELAAQLGRLRDVFRRVASRDMIISYIDIRFQDPVIGPRTS